MGRGHPRALNRVVILALLLVSPLALAEDPGPKAPATSAPETSSRRDPKGFTGISPFWEMLKKADGAVLARDFHAAIALYREAVAERPQDPMGHYRLGQAFVLAGVPAEAEHSYLAALRFASQDPALKGKVLFCLAELRLQQGSTDQALEHFAEYEAHLAAHNQTVGHVPSAIERKKRIQERTQLGLESARVKSRIEKRMKDSDSSAQKPAK